MFVKSRWKELKYHILLPFLLFYNEIVIKVQNLARTKFLMKQCKGNYHVNVIQNYNIFRCLLSSFQTITLMSDFSTNVNNNETLGFQNM